MKLWLPIMILIIIIGFMLTPTLGLHLARNTHKENCVSWVERNCKFNVTEILCSEKIIKKDEVILIKPFSNIC